MDKLNTWIKAERGRLTKLALAIKVTPGAITQWSKVPADRVVKVSEVTDIPRQELRPDLYEGMEAADFPADASLSRRNRLSARNETGVHHNQQRCT